MGRCHSMVRGAAVFFVMLTSLVVFSQDKSFDRNGQEEKGRKEASGQLERERWFRRGRTAEGRPAAELLQRAFEQRSTLRKSKLSQQRLEKYIQMGLKWKNLGPAPINSDQYGDGFQDYGSVTGRATAVAVDQTDTTGNTVYVGGAYGGLWKSTNAAAVDPKNVMWRQLLDDQPTLAVGAVALKPNDGKVILVGTGEPNNAGDSYYGLGILRSTDGGSTWTLISSAKSADGATTIPFKGMGFSRIVFSQDNPNLVLAAVAWTAKDLGSYQNGTYRGVYYSTDAGATWTKATFTNPDNKSVVHSAYGLAYNPATKHWFVSLGYRGFYTSTDGINWTRLANQPGGAKLDFGVCPTAGAASCVVYRSEISARPGSKNEKGELYAWYVNSAGTNQGIYLSTDDGASWTAIDTTGIDVCGDGSISAGCSTSQGTFNLTLAAVPRGDSTDLYAGAVNLFKCQITPENPTCTTDPFKNLTHVYGCYRETGTVGTLAHVHPDQHAIDFSVAHPEIVYFGNDGGIYRTLKNSELNSGQCTVPNPFDNLNANMGSMTQIVSFSQTKSDPSILLAGSQDNGTETTNPAIPEADKGPSGLGWTSYQGGDGGYNAINPDNADEWFASTPYGDIRRCGGGVNCRGSFVRVVDYRTFGYDDSAFYTPFMLDPQAPSQMIVGTCRVWRGASQPATAWTAALSPNLNTGDSTACDAAQHWMVSAMATGGPKVDGVGSEVIWAGLENGYIWVTPKASDGATSWKFVTPTFTPEGTTDKYVLWGGFPVSSITVDPSDPTGGTAYVTIMGFNTSQTDGKPKHVFKTTDMGLTWTNITGDLPDAPADAFAIDPNDKNILYVGTDVGVFMSTNNGTNWTEYGPSNGAGALPAVAITKLEPIVANGVRKLRVSTYGRGMWEIDLASYKDFTQTITPSTAKVVNGGTTTFKVDYTGLGTFNADVKVACTDLPEGITCTYNPETVGSTATSSTVTVKLDATKVTPGPHAFKITGTAGELVKTNYVTVNVTDFALAATATTGTVKAGNTAEYTITVSTDTGHSDAVALTCATGSGLPDKAECKFLPTSIAPGASSILSITTKAPTTAMLNAPHFGTGSPLFAFWFGMPGIVVLGGAACTKRKKAIMLALLVIVLISLITMTACGGDSKSSTPQPVAGTPPGTYTVTVTGTSGTLTHTTTLTLVVQ